MLRTAKYMLTNSNIMNIMVILYALLLRYKYRPQLNHCKQDYFTMECYNSMPIILQNTLYTRCINLQVNIRLKPEKHVNHSQCSEYERDGLNDFVAVRWVNHHTSEHTSFSQQRQLCWQQYSSFFPAESILHLSLLLVEMRHQ